VSSVPRLLGVAGAYLALPPWPGGGRPALRRRAALGLAVLVLAVLGVLLATGAMGRRKTASAADAPGRQAPPRAAATQAELAQAAPRASEARPPSGRVVPPKAAAALFAQRSWLVVKPAPLPAPPPPPQPTAPPFPYTFVGSYAPEGKPPVFFLARGDRLVEAVVGDRLDGVYRFESAAGGQLVFVYLPLDVRQTLAAGASR
jgi:hypothetical protein